MPHLEEDAIRNRAYQLWSDAGQPEGQEQEFWYQAERELAEEDDVETSTEANILDLPPVVPGSLTK